MNKKSATNIQVVKQVIKGTTGALGRFSPDSWKPAILTSSSILQGSIDYGFLNTLNAEWQQLVDEGTASNDYLESLKGAFTLRELLDFLEKDRPEHIQFSAMKNLFFVGAMENNSDDHLSHYYMKIARTLSSEEFLVMFAAYKGCCDPSIWSEHHHTASVWLKDVSISSNLMFTALVERAESSLIEKKLLSDRTHRDRSGLSLGDHYRLTDLAFGFCEYVYTYPKDLPSLN